MPVFIDTPDKLVTDLAFTVAGWVAGPAQDPVRLTVNEAEVPSLLCERPDVRAAFQALPFTSGIAATVDLLRLNLADSLLLALEFNGERVEREISISPGIQAAWREDARIRREHREFCLKHLRCPECGAAIDGTAQRRKLIACPSCQARFPQMSRAISMISGELALRANLATTHLVSSNPYTPAAQALIDRVTKAGGMVLDCGAGARQARIPGVINAEIVDYNSTDILAVGESLPFADATFDAVLSLAVLEHVRNPVACARELLRVTKPGGELLADVPFLQPEHGYPHHYYNMTAQGLANLFAGEAEPLEQSVPPHGHPIFAVQWILRDYANGLPVDVAQQFRAMSVQELIELDIPRFLADPRAMALDGETRRIIACLNTLHMKKHAS